MKKIIHLSDLHIGSTTKNGELHNGDLSKRFENLVHWLNTTTKLGDRKNYIIVTTGDIAHNGKGNDFKEAKNLLDTLDGDFEIFLVPGNHDYRTRESGCFQSPDIAAHEFNNLFFGGDNPFPRRAERISSNRDFPQAHVVDRNDGNNSIAFIGLDSGEAKKGKFSGKLGEKQLNTLRELLGDDTEVSNCRYKVFYLHHDPFKGVGWARKLVNRIPGIDSKGNLRDRSELLDILMDTATLVLYGHTHTEQSGDIDTEKFRQYGIKGIYNGGTSTGRHKHSTCIRIIDLKDPENPDEDTIPLFWEEPN